MDGSFDPIIEGLQDDLLTGEYSDMRLIDGQGTIHHVHKVVLCYQSPFFKNAMKKGRFKEGYENTIHLKDKNTLFVSTMLYYLYHQSFIYPSGFTTTTEQILFNIWLWTLADEYMITSLCKHTFNKLKDIMTSDTVMEEELGMSDFMLVVQIAYDEVPDTGKELRLLFARLAAQNILKLLAVEGFRYLMEDLPDFAFDLTGLLAMNCMKLSLGQQEDFLLTEEAHFFSLDEDSEV